MYAIKRFLFTLYGTCFIVTVHILYMIYTYRCFIVNIQAFYIAYRCFIVNIHVHNNLFITLVLGSEAEIKLVNCVIMNSFSVFSIVCKYSLLLYIYYIWYISISLSM